MLASTLNIYYSNMQGLRCSHLIFFTCFGVKKTLQPAAGEGSNPSEIPVLSLLLRLKYQLHTNTISPLEMCLSKAFPRYRLTFLYLQVYSVLQNYHIKMLQTPDLINLTGT